MSSLKGVEVLARRKNGIRQRIREFTGERDERVKILVVVVVVVLLLLLTCLCNFKNVLRGKNYTKSDTLV